MKKIVVFVVLSLLSTLSFAQQRNPASATQASQQSSIAAVDAIEDGSFEDGSPNAFWNEASTNFGSPLCDTGLCGDGAGTAGPRTGAFWSWFGGANGGGEIGSVDQDVTISAGAEVSLEFYLWTGSFDAAGTDAVVVGVDVSPTMASPLGVSGLLTIPETDAAYQSDYALVSLDLSAFADGGTHNIFIQGTDASGGNTNFSVDDVALVVQAPTVNYPVPAMTKTGLVLLAMVLFFLVYFERKRA